MTVNWEKIRKSQFPALKKLTYIMAASASPLSKSAYEKGISYFKDMLMFGDIHFDDFNEEINLARKIIAEYINAEPDEIAFFSNTSSGMAAVAYLLEKGKFLYPSLEFPASVHIFKKLGFPSQKILPKDNKFVVESFESEISEDIKYIIHSYVQSFNGFRQNLDELGDFCKNHHLVNIINATQSFGSFEIDVKRQNINILVSNALKWIGCGYGAGILYIQKDLIEQRGIPFSGWLSVEDPFSMDNNNLNVIKKTKSMDGLGGCPNFAALLSLKGGLDLIKNEIGGGDIKKGVKLVQERIIQLTSDFVEKIKDLHFKIITPLEIEFRSGIITIEHDNAEKIYDYLIDHDIFVTLKKYTDSAKNTLLRFAFNYYNNRKDINRVIDVLNNFKG